MSSKTGVGELKFVKGGRGGIARVFVEVEVGLPPIGHRVQSSIEKNDGHGIFYLNAALFGVEYGLEFLGRSKPDSLDIVVTKIDALVTDTTTTMVVYAAAHAIWDALGQLPSRVPVMDTVNHTITFPM